MVETVLAVSIISSLFFGLWALSRQLTAKIAAEHAAMRVARARAVGMNRFVCLKTARLASVPAAGRRLWPSTESLPLAEELGRFENYMLAADDHVAKGILDYEGWAELKVDPGDGTESRITLGTEWFDLKGSAGLERHAAYYLQDNGY